MLSFLWEVIARPFVVSLVAKPDKPTTLPNRHHDDLEDNDYDSDDDGIVVEHMSVWI